MSVDIYTPDKLRKILLDLHDSGVGMYRMQDIYKIKAGILLRHDVDDEMESSLEMAKMESGVGIQSTFYFLISCPFYNIFSQRGRYIIESIKGMGNEIGLHFDPSIYEDVDKNFSREINMLEEYLGNRVHSVSVHRPSLHNIYPNFKGFIDAYDKDLFSKNNYFSDSRFEFYGDIKEIIRQAKKGLVQLLFHPISYYLRDTSKPPNVISLYKNVIKGFGANLLDQALEVPKFSKEFIDCPTQMITVDIQIKK